ncbi:hypothetical protein M885DRAFT_546980 [Pelagophyceae sp. CCMP2097]|nr:hypothetical protein M885DRAFT_546980 [Pelagophyceae sp. CCMP2097]
MADAAAAAEPKDDDATSSDGSVDSALADEFGLDPDDPLVDLKAAWAASGEEPDEFTLKKFKRKLAAQAKVDFELSVVRGETDYEAKVAQLDKLTRRSKRLKAAAAGVLGVGKALARETRKAGASLVRGVEPNYVKRHRRVKVHLARISVHEARALGVAAERAGVQRGRKHDHKMVVGQEKGRLLHIAAAGATDDLRMALQRISAVRQRETDLDGFRNRRAADVTERNAKRQADEIVARALKYETDTERREWRTKHYSKVVVDARAEAAARRKAHDDGFDARDAELAARIAGEAQGRARAMRADQTVGPAITSPSRAGSDALGVFGGGGVSISVIEGGLQPSSADEAMILADEEAYARTDGRSGADHARVKIFSGVASPDHEEEWEALGDVEQLRDRADFEATAATAAGVKCLFDADGLDSLRKRHEMERFQLRAEHDLLQKKIAGPPRREANALEQDSNHRRQRRVQELSRTEAALLHQAASFRAKSAALDAVAASKGAQSAALSERVDISRSKLELHCAGAGEPPMVLGRHLGDAPGLGLSALEARPAEAFQAMTRMTQLELCKSTAAGLLATTKESRDLERAVWAFEQGHASDRADLDDMLARLGDVGRRVKKARSEDARSDLMTALQLWWGRGESLRAVLERHEGPINWWASRTTAACRGVEQWRSNDMVDASNLELNTVDSAHDSKLQGLLHGDVCTAVISGEMQFPKLDMYTVQFVVTKKDSSKGLGDSMDRCTIKLGTSARTLQVVEVILNQLDEYAGAARYDVSHSMRCDRLAYRFEFMSSSDESQTHFVVEQGDFSTKTLEPLEVSDGSNRVVSSFVKQLRVEALQGEQRYAGWLAELISAEDKLEEDGKRRPSVKLEPQKLKGAAAPRGMWDSAAIHGVPQRFPHGTFVNLLRTDLELLADEENAKSNTSVSDVPDENDTVVSEVTSRSQRRALKKRPLGEDAAGTKERLRDETVKASALRYLRRKRLSQQPAIDAGRAIVGRALEIFDEDSQKWAHNLISRCDVQWFDNGTRCRVRHDVVPVDELERPTGPGRLVDMTKIRSFVSSRVEPDPDTKVLWEANEAAAALVADKVEKAKRDVLARRALREASEFEDALRFEDVRRSAMKRKSESSYAEARSLLSTKAVKVLTKQLTGQVLEELRSGILKPEQLRLLRPKSGAALLKSNAPADRENVLVVDHGDDADFDESESDGDSDDSDVRRSPAKSPNKPKLKKKEASLSLSLRLRNLLLVGDQPITEKAFKAVLQKPLTKRDLAKQPVLPLTVRQITRKAKHQALLRACRQEAATRWLGDYVKAMVRAEARQWAGAAIQREADVAANRQADDEAEARAAKDEAFRDRAKEKLRAVQREVSRSRMRTKVGLIPGFERAVPTATNCEHVRAKAWGDRYGKGVRCLDCGKELTKTHLEVSQQRGLGGGDDVAMARRVARHRSNRAAYRAETGDLRQELADIEAERLRLEKETWLVRECEGHFYDLDDTKRVYDLDRRHQRQLKVFGIQRQGVQWTAKETMERAVIIAAGGVTVEKRGEMRQRNASEKTEDNETPRSKRFAKVAAESFLLAARPSTPRLEVEQRRGAYRDLVGIVGRVNNFRQRLSELAAQKDEVKHELGVLDDCLCHLHREIFNHEVHIQRIEIDLAGCAKVLTVKRVSQMQFDNAAEVLKQAKLDRKDRDIGLLGLADDAADAEDSARDFGVAVRDVLRQRLWQERQLAAVAERSSQCRQKANDVSLALASAQDVVASMHYRRRGVVVPTPYGHCHVLLFRVSDRMVVVQLPFGDPKARAYIPLDTIMQTERAIAASNLVAMRFEEAKAHSFYSAEAGGIDSEQRLMLDDETRLKTKLAFDADQEAERLAVAVKVQMAVEKGKSFVLSLKGQREIFARTRKSLDREVRTRDIASRTWRGKGKKPKKMSFLDKEFYKVTTFRALRKGFLLEQATLAESEARGLIERRNAVTALEHALEFVYLGFMRDFLRDVSEDGLRSGLEAKTRAEDETGVVFGAPAHMQHAVYTVLSRWWMAKKKSLKKQLEVWGAHSAQDELKREDDRQKRQALVRDVELKEACEIERARQFRYGQLLRFEEQYSRRIYREELRACLLERRQMKAEEHATRLHAAELAIRAKDAASKYRVGVAGDGAVGASSKEQRRVDIKANRGAVMRQKREAELMAVEDDLSEKRRTEERKLVQLEALRKEMELDDDGDDEVGDEGDEGDISSQESGDDGAAADVVLDPTALAAQRSTRRLERAKRRREKKICRANLKRDAAEQAATSDLEAARTAAFVYHAKVELEWMELEEEARLVEKEKRVAVENLRKVTLYCQRKGQEELRAKARSRTLRKACKARTEARDEAVVWLAACEKAFAKSKKTQTRVYADTKTMDTYSISGTFQRFETHALHKELHTHYFRTLAKIISNRAELIATERRAMLVHEVLRRNASAADVRSNQLKKLWRKRERNDLLRLRRSELGKHVFQKSQRAVLQKVFQGWLRFWMWHLGHKQAFELKYALIKHQVDLRRLHPKLLGDKIPGDYQDVPDVSKIAPPDDLSQELRLPHLAMHEAALPESSKRSSARSRVSPPPAQPEDSEEVYRLTDLPLRERARFPKTRLQRLQQRTILCRSCGAGYTEAHNRSDGCAYHSGVFKLACPKTCPAHYDSNLVKTSCMAHRATRWSCCDTRAPAAPGLGCAHRFHQPPRQDATYEPIARGLTETLKANEAALDGDLAAIALDDFALEARTVKRLQLAAISEKLQGERGIVARYKAMQLDRHIDDATILDVYEQHRKQQAEEKRRHEAGGLRLGPPGG